MKSKIETYNKYYLLTHNNKVSVQILLNIINRETF